MFARERELTLDIECPVNITKVLVDSSDYDKYLTNLISNAVKFTLPRGKLKLK